LLHSLQTGFLQFIHKNEVLLSRAYGHKAHLTLLVILVKIFGGASSLAIAATRAIVSFNWRCMLGLLYRLIHCGRTNAFASSFMN
jgi:hypothetical protein